MALLVGIAAVSFASAALAASDACDDATDPAYADGFQAGDNGGTGWGSSWASQGFTLPSIGSSTENGDGDDNLDGDIDVQGMAFRFATGTAGAQLTIMRRSFDGPLVVGDRFSFDFDNDPISTGGFVSLELQSVNNIRFGFGFYGSSPSGDYGIVDADGTPTARPISLELTDEGMHVVFALTNTDTFQLDVTPAVGQPLTEIGTLASTGAIDRFRLSAGGDGNARQSYFNSIGVNVPGPGAALGDSAALAALLVARRRRA